ncbi:hypothetical protein KA005_19090 [bacterium]|nr:hypothetical protein [bacterium]
MATGIQLIMNERNRQIEVEGFDGAHDDEHTCGELALAAALYAAPVLLYEKIDYARGPAFSNSFSWDRCDKRPHFSGSDPENRGNMVGDPEYYTKEQRLDLLVKAGALIAAEIDRLQRIDSNK